MSQWTVRDFVEKRPTVFKWWLDRTPFQTRVIGTEKWFTCDKADFKSWIGYFKIVPYNGGLLKALNNFDVNILEFQLVPEKIKRQYTLLEVIEEIVVPRIVVSSKTVAIETGIPEYIGTVQYIYGKLLASGHGPMNLDNFCFNFVIHEGRKELFKTEEAK